MKYSILLAIGFALICPLQAENDAAKDPANVKQKPCPKKVFKKKDKDNDGLLTKEEFTANAKDAAKAEARFTKLDKNSDGKLSLEEFTTKKEGGGKGKHKAK